MYWPIMLPAKAIRLGSPEARAAPKELTAAINSDFLQAITKQEFQIV
jgi:hypothetical protein